MTLTSDASDQDRGVWCMCSRQDWERPVSFNIWRVKGGYVPAFLAECQLLHHSHIFFQWVRTLACQCSAYFNCVTGGTNAPPVPAFVSPALVICPSFHDSIYGETNGKVEYNYRQMSDISLIYPKRRGENFLSRFAFTV